MRPLAVTSPGRSIVFPELPTLMSTHPGLDMELWYATFFPSAVNRDIVTRMNAEVNKAIDVGPEASDGKGPDIRSVMEETQELLQRLTREHAAADAARVPPDGGPSVRPSQARPATSSAVWSRPELAREARTSQDVPLVGQPAGQRRQPRRQQQRPRA